MNSFYSTEKNYINFIALRRLLGFVMNNKFFLEVELVSCNVMFNLFIESVKDLYELNLVKFGYGG